MGAHLINGKFQSDKYPTTPLGKVPLSTKDRKAQRLLWIYAQAHREVDAEFSDDLEQALINDGFDPHKSVLENEPPTQPWEVLVTFRYEGTGSYLSSVFYEVEMYSWAIEGHRAHTWEWSATLKGDSFSEALDGSPKNYREKMIGALREFLYSTQWFQMVVTVRGK